MKKKNREVLGCLTGFGIFALVGFIIDSLLRYWGVKASLGITVLLAFLVLFIITGVVCEYLRRRDLKANIRANKGGIHDKNERKTVVEKSKEKVDYRDYVSDPYRNFMEVSSANASLKSNISIYSDCSRSTESEPYFVYCQQTSELILDYIRRVMKNKDLLDTIMNIEGIEALDTDQFGKYNSRVVLVVFYDLWKCYIGTGNTVSIDNPALLSYSLATYWVSEGVKDLNVWMHDENIRAAIQSCGEQLMKFATSLGPHGFEDTTEFLMVFVYDRAGCDVTEYYKFIRDVAECMAASNIGNGISEEAHAYIQKIDAKINQASASEIEEVTVNSVKKLNQLIGIENVKNEVRKLSAYVRVQQWRRKVGLNSPAISYHCVFIGNPGTGKTTVARIIAEIYKDLGILKKGHLIETDRSGLVAEYVGQTAVKTNKIIDSALDGVLFIDEAYSLAKGGYGDYGQEAISTLLKRMEDNRDRLVVILAGYDKEIRMFIESNPGLQSRFNRYFHFDDFSGSELYEIFLLNVKKHEYITDPAFDEKVKEILERAVGSSDPKLGNARFVRNLFEKILENQATRLSCLGLSDRNSLQYLSLEDLQNL